MTEYNTKSKAMLPTYGPSLNPGECPFSSISEAESFFLSAGFALNDIYVGTEINIVGPDNNITTYKRVVDTNGVRRWKKTCSTEDQQTQTSQTAGGVCGTYLIVASQWGITEGLIEADSDGGYTTAQYDAMWMNAKGFTDAIYDAQTKGYTKVMFPQGTYCFCPCSKKMNDGLKFKALIWIRDASNLDIDLNNSTLRLLVDSSKHSPRDYAYAENSSYDTESCLMQVDWCENVSIHHGTMIGDRATRKWIIKNEVNQEQCFGIKVGSYSHGTDIHHMDISDFTGDAVCILETEIANGYQQTSGRSVTLNRVFPGRIANRGVHYGTSSNVVTRYTDSESSRYSISPIVSVENGDSTTTRSQVYTLGTQYKNIKKLKEERRYSFYVNGGYVRSMDINENFSVLTFPASATNPATDMPIRVIGATHFCNFKLNDDEVKIAVQVQEDTLGKVYTTDDATYSDSRGINFCVCGYVQDQTEIHHCYIHDNHRGGITGMLGHVKIHDNKFFKQGPLNGKPIFTRDNTNYHINNEDASAYRIDVWNNEFDRTDSRVGLLMFLTTKELNFSNNKSDVSLMIKKVQRCDVGGNVFYGGCGVAMREFSTADSSLNEGSGGNMRRHINVHDNFLSSFGMGGVNDTADIYKTTIVYKNNLFRLSGNYLPYSSQAKMDVTRDAFAKQMLVDGNTIKVIGSGAVSGNSILLGTWRRNYITFEDATADNSKLYFMDFDDTNIVLPGKYNSMGNNMILGAVNISGLTCKFMASSITMDDDKKVTYRNCTFTGVNTGNNINGSGNVTLRFENCKFTTAINTNAAGLSNMSGSLTLEFVNCDFSKITAGYLLKAKGRNVKVMVDNPVLPSAGLYLDNSSQESMATPKSGTTAPAFPIDGAIFKNTSTGAVQIAFDGVWKTLN